MPQLITCDVVQWDVSWIGFLIHEHEVTMAKRTPPNILPTDTHIVTCEEIHSNIDIAIISRCDGPGGCFTNVSRALQIFLSKFVYRKNRTSYENFKLKLCMCAQSHALGTHTKFQLEILTINRIFGIVYFRKISLESSRNVSETAPRCLKSSWVDTDLFMLNC